MYIVKGVTMANLIVKRAFRVKLETSSDDEETINTGIDDTISNLSDHTATTMTLTATPIRAKHDSTKPSSLEYETLALSSLEHLTINDVRSASHEICQTGPKSDIVKNMPEHPSYAEIESKENVETSTKQDDDHVYLNDTNIRIKPENGTKGPNKFVCQLCMIEISSVKDVKKHLIGARHAKKKKVFLSDFFQPPNKSHASLVMPAAPKNSARNKDEDHTSKVRSAIEYEDSATKSCNVVQGTASYDFNENEHKYMKQKVIKCNCEVNSACGDTCAVGKREVNKNSTPCDISNKKYSSIKVTRLSPNQEKVPSGKNLNSFTTDNSFVAHLMTHTPYNGKNPLPRPADVWRQNDCNQCREKLNEVLNDTCGYDKFETQINYKFNDKTLLLQALTHKTCIDNQFTEDYEKLEFHGDHLLNFLVTRQLDRDNRDTMYSPGDITGWRIVLLRNTTLAWLAVENDFHLYFRYCCESMQQEIIAFANSVHNRKSELSQISDMTKRQKQELVANVSERGPKVLADIFESVAAAIYYDSGDDLEVVWKVYEPLMAKAFELLH